ncbi:hypothetical protein C8R47DRAFT_227958 [Mycena vitilis]|nr:hypothetical protein C8R47DRAFT_227958 [Mycena vitilis]
MAGAEQFPTSSPKLVELMDAHEKTTNGLARCERGLKSLEQYLDSLTVQHLESAKLDELLEHCESTGARLDAKKVELTKELQRLDAEIAAENKRIVAPYTSNQPELRMQVAVGVFAQEAGDVEIALIYAVPHATWTAFYDIRVDMDTKEKPATLIHRAAVKQSTGEPWDDVPLQLETSDPTFGLHVPKLWPWNLNIYQAGLPPQYSRLATIPHRKSSSSSSSGWVHRKTDFSI